MMRSLWIAKTGLDAMQSNLDTISNNLANVSTTAFKRVRPIFEDLMYQNLREPGLISSNGNFVPAGLQAGCYNGAFTFGPKEAMMSMPAFMERVSG